MFCTECGEKTDKHSSFCSNCGLAVLKERGFEESLSSDNNEKVAKNWWHRLLEVIYILLYLPILLIVPLVWSLSSRSYDGYYGGQYNYTDTYGLALWYTFLTLSIYFLIVRLIKVASLYVLFGKKPEWKKEIKKVF